MGLLDNTTHQEYYQGNDHGNYQFTSLDNIITQFEIAYVGENKIIPKINRADIVFHAQRSLQELSFDTLKSCKSQEIVVPASLKMILPHDYVNYTKISWVDSAGIKHPLYYTHDTSNPFTIDQDENGEYNFTQGNSILLNVNGDYEQGEGVGTFVPNWGEIDEFKISDKAILDNFQDTDGILLGGGDYLSQIRVKSGFSASNPSQFIQFTHQSVLHNSKGVFGGCNVLYQKIDVSDLDFVNVSAEGKAANMASAEGAAGVLRVGLTTTPPVEDSLVSFAFQSGGGGPNIQENLFDLLDEDGNPSYVEWTTTNNTTAKTIENIDVSSVTGAAYLVVVSFHQHSNAEYSLGLQETNSVDNVFVSWGSESSTELTNPVGNEEDSVTWGRYKSHTPSENNINDYQDYQNDIYWPNEGRRYGLDPQRAQVNGSFYIDCRLGKIHFSSNISGRTVILDYISDSLGTDKEMQVHKFAEEAMYKSIAHAILSTSSYGQALIPRLTKEKFASIRKAKLRLSNLKLEELIQILRGKSKQIKH
tara:strand:+ start:1181 stop:2776 length:1596 start_codon:yes stop_codon:yes gene_type:complete